MEISASRYSSIVRWNASCSLRFTGTARAHVSYTTTPTTAGANHTVEELSDLVDREERRAGALVLFEPAEPCAQLDGGDLSDLRQSCPTTCG